MEQQQKKRWEKKSFHMNSVVCWSIGVLFGMFLCMYLDKAIALTHVTTVLCMQHAQNTFVISELLEFISILIKFLLSIFRIFIFALNSIDHIKSIWNTVWNTKLFDPTLDKHGWTREKKVKNLKNFVSKNSFEKFISDSIDLKRFNSLQVYVHLDSIKY